MKKKGSCNMTPTVDISEEKGISCSSPSLSSGYKTNDLKPNIEGVITPEKENKSESSFSQSETEPNLTKFPYVEKEKHSKTSTSVTEDTKPIIDSDEVGILVIEKESFEGETTNVHSEAGPGEKTKELPSVPEILKNGGFQSSSSEATELKSEAEIHKPNTPQKGTKSESSSSSLESKAEVELKEEVPPSVTEVTKELESEYEKKGSRDTIPVKEIESESSALQSKSGPNPTKSPNVEKEKDSRTFISVPEKETTNIHSEIPLQTEEEPEEKPKEELQTIPEFEVEELKPAVEILEVKTPQTETRSVSSSSPSQSKTVCSTCSIKKKFYAQKS